METGFQLLEDKVRKAVELVKRLRDENRDLTRDLGVARSRLTALERRLEALEQASAAASADGKQVEGLNEELKRFRHEREQVRTRIAKVVQALEILE
jgi:chromosome segregation ATPase